jgi:Protein of unknown function (DUF2878)
MGKIIKIFTIAIPILLMIGLIPLVSNDYLLSLLYIVIIYISFKLKRNKNDTTILLTGFIIMILSESFFIRTGVEAFNRVSLLGTMPLWLPILWSYGFVCISRAVKILE